MDVPEVKRCTVETQTEARWRSRHAEGRSRINRQFTIALGTRGAKGRQAAGCSAWGIRRSAPRLSAGSWARGAGGVAHGGSKAETTPPKVYKMEGEACAHHACNATF